MSGAGAARPGWLQPRQPAVRRCAVPLACPRLPPPGPTRLQRQPSGVAQGPVCPPAAPALLQDHRHRTAAGPHVHRGGAGGRGLASPRQGDGRQEAPAGPVAMVAPLPWHSSEQACPRSPAPSPIPTQPTPQVIITLNAAFCERFRRVCPPSEELERECSKVGWARVGAGPRAGCAQRPAARGPP